MSHRLPLEIIRDQRDGRAPSAADLQAVVQGLVDGSWSDAQVAAWAMAVVWRGMDRAACTAFTQAVMHSGRVLDWRGVPDLHGPVVDKHSTGGVGDKVSLVLAPLLAAAGATVPMVSGRGLAHTGGTLDKLLAWPGLQVDLEVPAFTRVLQQAGCAIVSAGPELAPADRRLYAIRDVTATVESVPLITASILGKKLAAGVQHLVMDVKVGSGAFAPTLDAALALARSLVEVAVAAGVPTRALLTDMDQVLGRTAGNALEVAECVALLTHPAQADARLRELVLRQAAHALQLCGVVATLEEGQSRATALLDGGQAAERWARMVRAQGGQGDPLSASALPVAGVQVPVPAPADGVVLAQDVRALGMAVVRLGGGRARPSDLVDPRVGLTAVCGLGQPVRVGEHLAVVHAATLAQAEAVAAQVCGAFTLGEPGSVPEVQALVRAVI